MVHFWNQKLTFIQTLCSNYERGTVLGLYFGGTCATPQDIMGKYVAVVGPTIGGPSHLFPQLCFVLSGNILLVRAAK